MEDSRRSACPSSSPERPRRTEPAACRAAACIQLPVRRVPRTTWRASSRTGTDRHLRPSCTAAVCRRRSRGERRLGCRYRFRCRT
jgi:hypothetical protein